MSEARSTQDPAGPVPGAARGPIPATGDPGIEAFGYRQELKRSLTFTDLLVYGLVFMVPIAPFGIFGGVFPGLGRNGRPRLRDRHAGHGVHRRLVLADVAGLPDGRLGLHLRRPRHRPAGRLPRRLDDPARLRARPRSALPDRVGRDELHL